MDIQSGTMLVTKRGKICTISFNQPQKMNPMTFEYVSLLDERLKQINEDDKIRIIVLTGAGENFSSGGDIKDLNKKHRSDILLHDMNRVTKLVKTMRGLRQPIICKVRGVAYGVGVNIALNGDFVIASHDAQFCQAFINLGAVIDGGGTFLLPRLVGLAKAKELAMLGKVVKGREAESIGLIYKSTPDAELDDEVDALAADLSTKPPLAMSMIKLGLNKSFEMSLDEAMDWEAVHQTVALQSLEHRKRVKAIIDSKGS